jgi:hypothetical protein
MAEHREQAKGKMLQDRPVNWVGASVIVGIWIGMAIIGIDILYRYLNA